MDSKATGPAEWLPDPTRRFEYRYWDGTRWTDHVARGGESLLDPMSQDVARSEPATGTSADPVGSAVALIRGGNRQQGLDALRRMAADPEHAFDALTVLSYELFVRFADDDEFGEGRGYLDMLHEMAPESREFNSLMTLTLMLQKVEPAISYFKKASAAADPNSEFGANLFLLADIAASELNYQILNTPTGESLRMTATYRFKGVVSLKSRKPADAYDYFAQGIDHAQSTVAHILAHTQMSDTDRTRNVANIRRDCRIGQALALLDTGKKDQALQAMTTALETYQVEYGPR